MTLNDAITRFSLFPFHGHIDKHRGHLNRSDTVRSAVLIPLIQEDNQCDVVFCKRPAYLKHHPYQICFPGGKEEPHDRSLSSTALRECQEEINIAQSDIQLIGQLPNHYSLTGFQITPFLGKLKQQTQWQNTSAEVSHVFSVPLSQLIQDSNWQTLSVKHKMKTIHFDGFMTSHGLLWGATANIVKMLIQSLK